MNKLIITGNLTKDLELKKTNSGKSVTNGQVAVQRITKDEQGNRITDFINFTAWGAQAEYLKTYANKGARVEMVGRLESRRYEDKNGIDHEIWELIVEDVTSFKKQETTPSGVDLSDDNLPF